MSNLPLSSRDTVRFTPKGLEGDNQPVFLLEVPTIRSRAAFRRDLAIEGAIWHDDAAVLQAFKDGISALYDKDQAAVLHGLLDRLQQSDEVEGVEATAEAKQALAEARVKVSAEVAQLEQEVRRAHPAYMRVLAERAHWQTLAPLLAAQCFLKGWENVSHAFERRAGRATDECLMKIDEAHLNEIGWKVIGLFRPSEAQAKN